MSITDWVEAELAPWRGVALDNLHERLSAAADADPTIALYRIGGSVSIERFDPDRIPERRRAMAEARAKLYQSFLAEVVAGNDLGGVVIALRLDDLGPHLMDAPVFSFQKRRFESGLLIPDVDIIGQDLLSGDDTLAFDEKMPEAVFVGSTTGALITAEKLANNEIVRIRSACFFRDKPAVAFELPGIVQCDTPETAAVVAAMDLGSRRWSWPEQFRYRYLLSMDGNGATCSRVVKALASNSALVKYASAHLLYYFHGLEPWVHYLPVTRDAEVLTLIEQSEMTGVRDEAIARRGAEFAAKHLGRPNVIAYTAALLRGYAGLI